MDTPTLCFRARPEATEDDRTLWSIAHPDWDGKRGFAILIQSEMLAADRQDVTIALKTPPIHVAPRAKDRGKPRTLILSRGAKVLGLFEAQSWVEDLAKQVKSVLEASNGDWHKADSFIGREFAKLSDARVGA